MHVLALTLALAAAVPSHGPDPKPRVRRVAVARDATARVTILPLERTGSAWDPQTILVTGTFGESLYETLDAAIPDSVLDAQERVTMAWDVANVLRWEIDFTRDPDLGTPYVFVFERLLGRGGQVRYGRLVAARLERGATPLEVYEYDSADGRTLYFDAAGMSLERSFLSAPLEFRRISSGFARARRHPVLGTWRAHQGIDYAADTGTPVSVVADGVVTRAGWAGGYGRLVEVRHANGAITRYAHLSAIAAAVKRGASVRQGQVIGQVGASGLATGPHLHYELLLAGRPVDPRRVNGGSGTPLPEYERPGFALRIAMIQRLLASTSGDRALAQAASAP